MHEPIQEQEAVSRKSELHAQATTKQWRFQNFATVNAALTFVNASPAQVAGEISATARNDGTVGMFYFL